MLRLTMYRKIEKPHFLSFLSPVNTWQMARKCEVVAFGDASDGTHKGTTNKILRTEAIE